VSLTIALQKLQRALERLAPPTSRSKKSQRRKPAKRLSAPNRDDRAADELVARTRAERDATRPPPVVTAARDRLAELAWTGRGHDYSQAATPASPGTKGVPLRRRKRRAKSAHLGDVTTTGLE